MSSLASMIEKFKLSCDEDNEITDLDQYLVIFEYYTSSEITSEYEEAVKQLDTTSLSENYQWLLFTGFHAITADGHYNNDLQDALCALWLPHYERMLKELLPTEATEAQKEDTGRLRLNAIKYLVTNMIVVQQTSESMVHIMKRGTQFETFTQKDEYLAIIKTILPLLINPNILERLETEDHTDIKLEWSPNNLSNTTNVTATFAMAMILKLLLMFIKTDADCLTVIKLDKSVKEILLKSMRQIKDTNPIKLSIYAILALLLNEEDIKNEINDPQEITTALITNIKKFDDAEDEDTILSINGVHIIDMLVALKAFLQHDQVKNSFIENDGIALLIEGVKETLSASIVDFNGIDDIKAQLQPEPKPSSETPLEPGSELQPEPGSESQPEPVVESDPELLEFQTQLLENLKTDTLEIMKETGVLALECLFVMSFNQKAADIIKKNEEFMSEIRKLVSDKNTTTTTTTNEGMKKAADGLLWKLEKEDEFKKQQQQETSTVTKKNDEFDLMISYSWSDKPLVLDIYKYLTEQHNYRIWLDENQMTGSLCQAMAQAVEKSKFVLMCMSEPYKGSENCRNEAEYARDRKKTIIPLIMNRVERDGWLGFISAGKIYIDFVKQDFQKAIDLLMAEIERNQRDKGVNFQAVKAKEESSTVVATKLKPTGASGLLKSELPVRPSVISDAYRKTPMESWSEQHVQDFLYDKKLDVMILLTEHMDGDELNQLFEKCQTEQNCWLMYDRLDKELEKRHQQTLPLSVYLRFLNQTQKCTNVASF